MDGRYKKIGIFDSGIGGIAIANALFDFYPNAEFLYIADTAHLPYGDKSIEEIYQLSEACIDFLLKQGAEIIIIACHTVSANVLSLLQKKYPGILFIGMIEPLVQKISQITKNNRIGILATQSSINSHAHRLALLKHNPTYTLFEQACPGLANAIEFELDSLHALLANYLAFVEKNKIDTLVLGCTHYSFVRDIIKKLIPESCKIVATEDCFNTPCSNDSLERLCTFFVTGDVETFKKRSSSLIKKTAKSFFI